MRELEGLVQEVAAGDEYERREEEEEERKGRAVEEVGEGEPWHLGGICAWGGGGRGEVGWGGDGARVVMRCPRYALPDWEVSRVDMGGHSVEMDSRWCEGVGEGGVRCELEGGWGLEVRWLCAGSLE